MSRRRIKSSKVFAPLVVTLFSIIITFSLVYLKNKEVQNTQAAIGELIFPADHAPHPGFDAEWWYLNMNLTVKQVGSDTPQKRSHILSLSRILGKDYLLVTNYKHNTSFDEKTYSGKTLVYGVPLGIGFEFNSNPGTDAASGKLYPYKKDGEVYYFKLEGSSKQIPKFNLTLKIPKFNDPLVWGCVGKISVFKPGDTYYYSVPNIVVTGTLTYPDGNNYVVNQGFAWMDHQWFSGGPPSDWRGHYWLSSRINSNLSLGFVTQEFISGFKHTYWVMRKDDKNFCGYDGNVTVLENWSNGYPKKLRIKIDDKNDFVVTNSSDNQIIIPPAGPPFYEPAIQTINGVIDGVNRTSRNGFFETHLKN